ATFEPTSRRHLASGRCEITLPRLMRLSRTRVTLPSLQFAAVRAFLAFASVRLRSVGTTHWGMIGVPGTVPGVPPLPPPAGGVYCRTALRSRRRVLLMFDGAADAPSPSAGSW